MRSSARIASFICGLSTSARLRSAIATSLRPSASWISPRAQCASALLASSLKRPLDVLQGQLRLLLLAVGPGAVGVDFGGARVQLDGAREIVRVPRRTPRPAQRPGRAPPAPSPGGESSTAVLKSLSADGALPDSGRPARAASADIGVAGLEGDRPAEVLDRLVIALDRQPGLGAAAIAAPEARIEADRAREIADRTMRPVGSKLRPPASAQCSRAGGGQSWIALV